MVDESVLWVRVMGSEAELSPKRITQIVEQAVEIFLGHYRAIRDPNVVLRKSQRTVRSQA